MGPILIGTILENVKSAVVFNDPLTVIGGVLNFTLTLREFWGMNLREYRQKVFLSFFPRGEKSWST